MRPPPAEHVNAVDHAAICRGKTHYRTASAAYRGMTRFQKRKAHHFLGSDSSDLRPYRCKCGQGWCLGHTGYRQ